MCKYYGILSIGSDKEKKHENQQQFELWKTSVSNSRPYLPGLTLQEVHEEDESTSSSSSSSSSSEQSHVEKHERSLKKSERKQQADHFRVAALDACSSSIIQHVHHSTKLTGKFLEYMLSKCERV
jgi:hypothetical protein